MERDREGFAYPVIDGAKCAGCGLCARICPVLKPRETRHLPAAFAAWNRDGEVRRDSTSGGVFSALADFVLEGGGVVFGAALDDRQRLRHTACFSKKELWRFRGAKFLQSDLGLTFRMARECLETLPGVGAVRLPWRQAGKPDHLRPGLRRRPLPRPLGGYGPLHRGPAEKRPPGGTVLQ